MNIKESKLPGVITIEPRTFEDSRGFFLETWNKARYDSIGISGPFVQDNMSFSHKGVLRGLHFQNPNGQDKLVYALQGEVYDVAVDIRIGSPTFGQWAGCTLSAENKRQCYIPAGFAHGFCVMSDTALIAYKCTDYYNPEAEGSILWNDPDLSIDWPIENPDLSGKDAKGTPLADFPEARLPSFTE